MSSKHTTQTDNPKTTQSQTIKEEKIITILLDPGHGGSDPGKIGNNNILEKDINLSIALKCKAILEGDSFTLQKSSINYSYKVILTRETDQMLSTSQDSNKKASDMKKRRELIETSQATLAVSIHQNSFPSPTAFGAQVFYYNNSNEGEKLAKELQKQLLFCNPENKRQCKANDSYYILKSGTCPVVICECGFLSNPDEGKKLATQTYQTDLAYAIAKGIHEYFKKRQDVS